MNHSLPEKKRLASRADSRTGFTLLELMLVLAVLAAVTVMAWPHLQPGLSRAGYRNAAMQLKSDLAEAREQAIHDGRIREFRMKPGTGRYLISVAMTAGKESSLVSGEGLLPTPAVQNQTSSAAEAMEPLAEFRELPDEMVFRPLETEDENTDSVSLLKQPMPSDTEPASISENAAPPNETLEDVLSSPSDLWVLTARFYPDGRATSETIELEGPDRKLLISVSIRGLTGGVTMGAVTSQEIESTGQTFNSDMSTDDATGSEQP